MVYFYSLNDFNLEKFAQAQRRLHTVKCRQAKTTKDALRKFQREARSSRMKTSNPRRRKNLQHESTLHQTVRKVLNRQRSYKIPFDQLSASGKRYRLANAKKDVLNSIGSNFEVVSVSKVKTHS